MSATQRSGGPSTVDELDRFFLSDFSLDEYRSRRERLMARMPSASLALIAASPKNRDHEVFRQNNDFAYLCGVIVPHGYLLLDCGRGTASLFLPHQSDELRGREGPVPSAEIAAEVARRSGVDDVFGIEVLARRLEGVTVLLTPFRQAEGAKMSWDTLQRAQQDILSDPWDGRPDRTRYFLQVLRSRFPSAVVKDLAPDIDALRLIKSEAELALLRVSGKLSAIGLVEAMRCTRPGVYEYQIEAAMRYHYLVNGARDVSYRAIVAGGANAWYGHYAANDCVLRDGDLLLFDCGPDYHYYASDITRMWPVNGTYSPVQRELYGYMLTYHLALLEEIRPGDSDLAILERVKKRMIPVIEKTSFSKTIYRDAALRSLERPTPFTHSVGMAVHDVGHYRGKEIPPGVVFALDPQLIIPEERIYIRVEDTVAVTETGIENFTVDAPYDMDEVERTMKHAGMIEEFGPWSRG